MNKLFITLYDFFERRRALLCTVQKAREPRRRG